MPQSPYHPSIEGAQHGAKSLAHFLDYAKKSGAAGAQPSNYMLQGGRAASRPRKRSGHLRDARHESRRHLRALPVLGAHHGVDRQPDRASFHSRRRGARSRPKKSRSGPRITCSSCSICRGTEVKVLPMFWGVAFGWEVATRLSVGLLGGPRLRSAQGRARSAL